MGKRSSLHQQRSYSKKRQRRKELEQQLQGTVTYEDRERFTRKALEARTEAQGHYILSMQSNQLTFGVGPAGTGKTFCCTYLAAQLFADRKVAKIIVTRPAVEAGGGLGFLPGTIQEKFEPYFAPFRQVLEDYFGASHLEYLIRRGQVEIAPLEYIRGLTFDDAFVILDEAQNTTPTQMKLFLTRLGQYSRVVVNGDVDQKDIRCRSGLEDAIERLEGCPGVNICHFTEDDVVRSGLVREILKRYRNP